MDDEQTKRRQRLDQEVRRVRPKWIQLMAMLFLDTFCLLRWLLGGGRADLFYLGFGCFIGGIFVAQLDFRYRLTVLLQAIMFYDHLDRL